MTTPRWEGPEPSARRRGALIAFFCGALLVLLAAQPAAAAVTREYSGTSFGPDGTPGSSFGKPGAIAVDAGDGSVYVADTAAGAVYRFTATGAASDFGALGSNELQGLTFNSAEPGTSELAVDPAAGILYAADLNARAVRAYKTNGEPSVFTATGTNQVGSGEVCGVAVDANGDVYVGTYNGGVDVFDSTGNPLAGFAAAEACNLAVDSEGAVYVAYYPAVEVGEEGKVEKFIPSAFPVTAATEYSSAGTVDANLTFGISLDPSNDDLYANEGSRISIYGSDGIRRGGFGEAGAGALSGSEGVAVGAESAYASAPGTGRVEIFGPVVAAAPEKPQVLSAGLIAVGTTTAKVRAEIKPGGGAGAYQVEYGPGDCALGGCSVGASGGLGASEAAETVTAELTGLVPGVAYHYRVLATNGSGAAASGDATFRTYPALALGGFTLPDGRAFELVSGDAPGGAEVGTPTSAGGLVLSLPQPQRAAAGGGAVSYRSFTAYAEPSGSPGASQYLSRRGAGGWSTQNITIPDATSKLSDPVRGLSPDLSLAGLVASGPPLAPGASSEFSNLYLRDNRSGALTALTTTTPQRFKGEFCVTYVGASADGSRVFFAANGALTADAPEPAEENAMNMYEWSAAGGVRLVNVASVGGIETPVALGLEAGFAGGRYSCQNPDSTTFLRRAISIDGSRVVWTRAGAGGAGRSLYSRLEGARSVQLDAAVAGAPGPSGGGVFGDASADGSRVFFYSPNQLRPGATARDLYRYEIGPETLTDLTTPVAAGESTRVLGVLGANEAGTMVYFVAEGDLTGAAGSNPNGATAQAGQPNLYLWRDGAGVRFIATLQGGPGLNDSTDWVNGFETFGRRENTTSSVTPSGNAVAFISKRRLTAYDNDVYGAPACRLDFSGQPVGDRGCHEVYLYDAGADSLVCASCSPSGAPPVSVPRQNGLAEPRLSTLPPWATAYEPSRNLAPDGSRVFFETIESLLPRDTNGKSDVYQFERLGAGGCSASAEGFSPGANGCVALISTGGSDADSYFVDASTDGGDAFLATRQPLVGADRDENYDVYDARIGGGFPEPPGAVPPCLSEGACRAPASAPPAGATPASSVPSGRGNLPRRRCPKARRGKARHGRAGRCAKARHKHRHRRGDRRGHRDGGHHREHREGRAEERDGGRAARR